MKTDLRIVKTKNSLYYALIELLKEKTFEEIKVSNICEKALINRSTFYSHYNDKYELFVDLINTLKDSLKTELKEIEEDNLKDYYLKMIKVFLNHIEGKEDIYKSILVNNRSSIIIDMIYDTIKEDINERTNNNDKGVPNDVFTSYYLGGVVNIVIEWFKNNKKYSKEQMIEYLDKLMV
ncbi:MAG: TetR/AcrR family transcriptional regulator [Bacilli bacterium]|nr:TetR/AcrR family transcriptional regulator [Bacilli bacterium]